MAAGVQLLRMNQRILGFRSIQRSISRRWA
jgi:hypothetical protein